MATVTHVFSIDYVAILLDEDAELLRAIVRNDDNLSYGNIISVVTGEDEVMTAPPMTGSTNSVRCFPTPVVQPTNGTTSLTPSSTTKKSSPASRQNPCGDNRTVTKQDGCRRDRRS
jgi:hypothetical protein